MNFLEHSGRPQAMVVLASEQVWPNIEGIVYWHERAGGLTDLFIYYTEDEQKSAGPARRLKVFVESLYPRIVKHPAIRIHLPDRPGPGLPHEVFGRINQWVNTLPNHHFIVNITGGTKLMTAGALAAMHLPRTTVVYRELSGRWFRIGLASEGQTTESFDLPPDICDHVPLELLVQAQYCPAGMIWESSPVPRIPVDEMVELGLCYDWNWNQVFRQCRLPCNEQAGRLFEQFVAGCVQALGIREVRTHLVLKYDAGLAAQEVDIAATYHSRLFLIDCKLTSAEEGGAEKYGGVSRSSTTFQILQAESTRRCLGGLGAKMLLLRPARDFGEIHRRLLSTFGLEGIGALDTQHFFRKLAKFFGLSPSSLPQPLAKAQELLDREKFGKGTLEFFVSSGSGRPLTIPHPAPESFSNHINRLNQDWMVYERGENLQFQGLMPDEIQGQDLGDAKKIIRERLNWLEAAGFPLDWNSFEVSKGGNSFQVNFVPPTSEKQKQLPKVLVEQLGKRFFSS
jgi:hypothetical protein